MIIYRQVIAKYVVNTNKTWVMGYERFSSLFKDFPGT